MRHPGEARTGLVGTWFGAVLALILGAACSDNAVVAKRDAGPVCAPSGATELACSDGVDDDCDGQTDCLDPDCAGVACGGADGFHGLIR